MSRANANSGHSDTTDADLNVFSDAEIVAMETALAAARQGVRGANPLVGAVIIDADGTVLAIGHHRGAGTPTQKPTSSTGSSARASSGTFPPPPSW